MRHSEILSDCLQPCVSITFHTCGTKNVPKQLGFRYFLFKKIYVLNFKINIIMIIIIVPSMLPSKLPRRTVLLSSSNSPTVVLPSLLVRLLITRTKKLPSSVLSLVLNMFVPLPRLMVFPFSFTLIIVPRSSFLGSMV